MTKKKNAIGEQVSVNLLPISILLAAIIISATLLFTQSDGSKSNSGEEISGESTTSNDTFKDAKINIDDDPILGDPDKANVAIVEFTEYRCGYCGSFTSTTLPKIIENYIDTGKAIYIFRDFQMYGEQSQTISKIGTCVYKNSGIDEFLLYHESAFNFTFDDNDPNIALNEAYEKVTEINLNKNDIENCVLEKAEELDADLTTDMSDASAIGIGGTPAFVIGKLDDNGNVKGVLIPGAYPYEDFERVLNSYLSE